MCRLNHCTCRDDGRDTHTGRNPGREKATAAARAVAGLAVFPEPLPDGGGDFNDLRQTAGYGAVGTIVNQAIDFYEPTPATGQNARTANSMPDQWREQTGALCAGNSRLMFAVACAFAGPLLRPAGMESGGFHYRCDSSSGKTTDTSKRYNIPRSAMLKVSLGLTIM